MVGRQVLALVARVRVLPPQPKWPYRLVVQDTALSRRRQVSNPLRATNPVYESFH